MLRYDKCRVRWLVTALAAVAAAPCVRADESVELKRKCNPDERSYLDDTIHVAQTITGMPQGDMNITMDQVLGVWEQAVATEGGGQKVTMTFDHCSYSREMPMMGPMSYDSDDPDNEKASPMLSAIFEPMIGESLVMEIGPDGSLQSFSGMDAIGRKISNGAGANMFWMQMQPEFTDEAARINWAQVPLSAFANREVKPGDTWTATSSRDIPRLGTFVTDLKYKLDKIGEKDGRKSAFVSFTGTVRAKPGADNAINPQVEGTLKGTGLYDIARGRFLTRVTDTKMIMKMPQPGGAPDQMVTFDIDTTSSSSLLSESDRAAQKAAAKAKIEAREAKAAEEAAAKEKSAGDKTGGHDDADKEAGNHGD